MFSVRLVPDEIRVECAPEALAASKAAIAHVDPMAGLARVVERLAQIDADCVQKRLQYAQSPEEGLDVGEVEHRPDAGDLAKEVPQDLVIVFR